MLVHEFRSDFNFWSEIKKIHMNTGFSIENRSKINKNRAIDLLQTFKTFNTFSWRNSLVSRTWKLLETYEKFFSTMSKFWPSCKTSCSAQELAGFGDVGPQCDNKLHISWNLEKSYTVDSVNFSLLASRDFISLDLVVVAQVRCGIRLSSC